MVIIFPKIFYYIKNRNLYFKCYTSQPSNTINNNLQSRIFYNDDNTNITNNE